MDEAPSLPVLGPFELSGGDLSLDFVNTWGDRGRPETDQLLDYPQLLAFARQTGLLASPEVHRLEALAKSAPQGAAQTTLVAREFREALYGIFSARAHDREVPAPDLDCLNRILREALPNLCLQDSEASIRWCWRHEEGRLTSPLWPIARAAADLLTLEAASPVRECGGSQCTWLFLDHSRGRSRRWCSMASCGNRAKARRHYHRGKGKGPS